MIPSASASDGPRPDGDQDGHRPAGRVGVRAHGTRDRTGDQPEAEERDAHVREYRSRSVGRVPVASARAAPALPPLAFAPLALLGRRARVVRADWCDGPSAGARSPGARRADRHRTGGSVAPRRTAPRSARRCRSAGHTTSTRALASGRAGPLRPAATAPARPRHARAGTRSPRDCRSGSARRPTGRSDHGRTG